MSIVEDLVELICSLIASRHLFSLSICKLQSVSRSGIVELVNTKQVSTANRLVLQDKAFGRSLTFMRKRRGSRVEPWETPILIDLVVGL